MPVGVVCTGDMGQSWLEMPGLVVLDPRSPKKRVDTVPACVRPAVAPKIVSTPGPGRPQKKGLSEEECGFSSDLDASKVAVEVEQEGVEQWVECSGRGSREATTSTPTTPHPMQWLPGSGQAAAPFATPCTSIHGTSGGPLDNWFGLPKICAMLPASILPCPQILFA